MAPRREKTVVNMPVYAMGFATKNRLLIAGGGGSSRSGVLNAVVGSVAHIYKLHF